MALRLPASNSLGSLCLHSSARCPVLPAAPSPHSQEATTNLQCNLREAPSGQGLVSLSVNGSSALWLLKVLVKMKGDSPVIYKVASEPGTLP